MANKEHLLRALKSEAQNIYSNIEEIEVYFNRTTQNQFKQYEPNLRSVKTIIRLEKPAKRELKKIMSLDGDVFASKLRLFMDTIFKNLYDALYTIFLLTAEQRRTMTKKEQTGDNPLSFIGTNYLLLTLSQREIKELINKYHVSNYKAARELIVDETSPVFNTDSMIYCEYGSRFDRIREITQVIIDRAPDTIKEERVILEQQISEIIKNAIKHGNKNNPRKKVKIWYVYEPNHMRIIVEDEGSGFSNLSAWNEFNRKRNKAIDTRDIDAMMELVSWKGPTSTDEDGGNALIAALEYWDSSLVYNNKKNKVAAVKYFY